VSKLQIIELQNQIARKDAYILELEAKLSAPQIAFDKYVEALGGVGSDAWLDELAHSTYFARCGVGLRDSK
jgi:hypothetical protein